MNNILKGIQDKIGAENCSRSCSKDKCKVDLNGTPSPHLIADPESKSKGSKSKGSKSKKGKGLTNDPPDNKKECDLIFFFQDSDGKLVIAPLELKTGEVKATLVRQQLQAGVHFAERMIPESCCLVCQPILFHVGNLHKFQRDKLNQAKILFRGTQLTIQTAKCSQPGNLAKALSNKRGQSPGRRRR